MNNLPKKPNIVIFLNDQDSAGVVERWPQAFEDQYLPATKRLKQHGLTFNRMFTASAACSPSRAALLTSTYPAENGVEHTLAIASPSDRTAGDPPLSYTQNMLRPSQLNLAHTLKAAGYKVVWKGKWHLSHAINGTDTWSAEDVDHMERAYGFYSWNPSDSGYSKSDPKRFAFSNDSRYVGSAEDQKLAPTKVDSTESQEYAPDGVGVLDFIKNYKNEDGPFCLIVSLGNPHDIHVAPFFSEKKGYTPEEVDAFSKELKDKNIHLPVPHTVIEDLSMKPSIQELWKQISIGVGDRTADSGSGNKTYLDKEGRQTFVNFYAYLKTKVEAQMVRVLDALEGKKLLDNTLIVRTSDHGELCLAHGLREKAFNAYEEAIRIPLIISNPKLFPEARKTDVLASSIDILPTLAKIAEVYDIFKFAFRGSDLTPLFENPQAKVYCSYKDKNGQNIERDYIHYTYDDGYLPDRFNSMPLRIRTIRTDEWKYSVYFNNAGSKYDYELYNLQDDPYEESNLAGPTEWWDLQMEMHGKLEKVLIELGTIPSPYWIFTEEMQKQNPPFVPALYWPTKEEAILGSKIQFEGNLVKQKYRMSELIQHEVNQTPADLWWVY